LIEETHQALIKAILNADRAAANKILGDWAQNNDPEKTIHDILEPTLEKIGEFWEKTQTVSLAQAYVAAKISEDFMLKVVSSDQYNTLFQTKKGPVVIGNIEDDY